MDIVSPFPLMSRTPRVVSAASVPKLLHVFVFICSFAHSFICQPYNEYLLGTRLCARHKCDAGQMGIVYTLPNGTQWKSATTTQGQGVLGEVGQRLRHTQTWGLDMEADT